MLNDLFFAQKNDIELKAFALGKDLVVTLTGGKAHLGAVGVGMCYGPKEQKSNASLIAIPGHKEDVLVFPIARRLSKALKVNVCVLAGIHFDGLTPQQVMEVVQTAENLVDELIEACKHQKK